MKKQVEEWLRFAELDLRSAKKLLEDPTLTQNAAFHIHQSVEKCFKAGIENLNVKILKIHDLEKLQDILKDNGMIFKTDMDQILSINNIYIEARYPGDQGLVPEGTPSPEFINEIYEFAEKVIDEMKVMVG